MLYENRNNSFYFIMFCLNIDRFSVYFSALNVDQMFNYLILAISTELLKRMTELAIFLSCLLLCSSVAVLLQFCCSSVAVLQQFCSSSIVVMQFCCSFIYAVLQQFCNSSAAVLSEHGRCSSAVLTPL